MMIPLYVVSCTSSIPADAPEQAVFCDHLKSNMETHDNKSLKTLKMITSQCGIVLTIYIHIYKRICVSLSCKDNTP